MQDFSIEYRGKKYRTKAELLNKYHLSTYSDSINVLMKKYDIDKSDAIDYFILRHHFKFKAGYHKSDVYCCECKRCCRKFIFTMDMALNHVIDCPDEDKYYWFYKMVIENSGLEDLFDEYSYRFHRLKYIPTYTCGLMRRFISDIESMGYLHFRWHKKEYRHINDFLDKYEVDCETHKLRRKVV